MNGIVKIGVQLIVSVPVLLGTSLARDHQVQFPEGPNVEVLLSYSLAFVFAVGCLGLSVTTFFTRQQMNRLQKRWAEAQVALKEMDYIFNYTPIKIFIKDEKNTLLRANKPAAESLGMTVEQVEGSCTYDLFPEMAAKYHRDDLEVLKSGIPRQGFVEKYTPLKGKPSWIRTDKIPYRDHEGQPRLFVALLDLTYHFEMVEALQESEQRFDLALDGAAHGLLDWRIDENKAVLSAQNFTLLGEPDGSETFGLTWWQSKMHHEDLPDVMAAMRAHLQNEELLDVTYRIQHADGSWRWWRTRGKASRSDEGQAVRLVGTNSDVTDLVNAQHTAEAASQAKSEFLANVSHEIRTPLNGVLGMAQVLQDSDLNQKQRSVLSVILESGQALLTTLNDILDISRIEARQIDNIDVDFCPIELGQSLIGLSQPEADRKGLALEFTCSGLPEQMLVGGQARIRQIATNLLSNAVKFTENGTIKLVFEYLPGATPDDGGTFVLSVADEGIGMAQESVDELFKPFVQVDGSTTRAHGGAGLGLSIVDGLVKGMGGEISVHTKLGEGTTIRVSIPVGLAHGTECPPSDVVKAYEQTLPAPTRLRILAAEDNEMNQLVLEQLLMPLNHDVTFVWDGQAAVTAWEEGDFDLILMDVQMPVLDGKKAIGHIREHEQSLGRKRVPIIVLTANIMSHQVDEYLKSGADGYVAKPILEEALHEAIRVHSEPADQDKKRLAPSQGVA